MIGYKATQNSHHNLTSGIDADETVNLLLTLFFHNTHKFEKKKKTRALTFFLYTFKLCLFYFRCHSSTSFLQNQYNQNKK